MAHDLRSLIPRSFGAFLGRFDRPSDVQVRAIPEIIAGRDVLISAPTAAGKTEAFAAPTAEIVLARGRAPMRALFVSPTRALANDLKRRLEGAFHQAGVSLGRYTGEHKEKVDGRLPDVAITTPEALDSLLARRPTTLRNVRLVVLDEIHVIDGSARGDQTRVLLHRLEAAAEVRPQRVAVSATVETPEETALRYLADPALVLVGGGRSLRAKRFGGASAEALAEHLTDLAGHGFRKILVFCNRREDVENHAAKLRGLTPFGDLVFPHHGSLAQAERERTERMFLHASTAVVVSTMTLEMGIDIGSIDYVLLAAPPPGVASLLQRVGRGNRRSGTTRAGYAVKDAGQEHICRVLLRAAARGELLGQGYAFRPSIVAQQAMVLCGSKGWIDATTLAATLPAFVLEGIAPTTPQDILDALAEADKLERSQQGRFVLAEKTETLYRVGELHSNISAELVLEVVDRITGDVIGSVSPQTARRMQLGARGRKVVAERESRVLTDAARSSEAAKFTPRGVPFVTLDFARRVVAELGSTGSRIVQAPVDGAVFIAHGLGTVGALLLQVLLGAKLGNNALASVSPFAMQLATRVDVLPPLDRSDLERFVSKHAERLATLAAMGPHHRTLPKDLRVRSVREASCIDAVAELWRQAELVWVERPDDEFRRLAPLL